MDRRGFLLAGGAAIGATALGAWPLRVRGQTAGPSVGGAFVTACCAGSGGWENPLANADGAPLREGCRVEGVAGEEPGARVEGPVMLGVLGAAVGKASGLARVQVEVDFTRPEIGAAKRLFLAMAVGADEGHAGGVACRVPADPKGVRLRLTTQGGGSGENPASQDVCVPARRGVYVLGWSVDGRTSGRVRWTEGVLESDWPCCVLVCVGPASQTGTGGTK
jgi:hypothetical protein